MNLPAAPVRLLLGLSLLTSWLSPGPPQPSGRADAASPTRQGTANLDGVYAYLDPAPPQWWSCLRCAEYRPTGGAWLLEISHGRLTLTDETTGWSSHAAVSVQDGMLELFDDPVCLWERGHYAWRFSGRSLLLEPMEDTCAFGLRGRNLGRGPWADCRPPDARAAASDAWPRPPGCPRPKHPESPTPSLPADLSLRVLPGDARLLLPDLMAIPANTENLAAPPGVEIRGAPEVVRYGLYLVLWQEAPWVEASFQDDAPEIGVQFWGPVTMGSVRILVDRIEIWRGEPSRLGELRSQYGGYIEVGGLSPGPHTLRVERLPVDSRPVRIMFFGLG